VAYNLIVPTPFDHLSVAEDLMRGLDLPSGTCDYLNHYRPESLFGNTAPNVQTISELPRPATRFSDVPILPGASCPVKRWDALGKLNRDCQRLMGKNVYRLAIYLAQLKTLEMKRFW
jgi:hypothetical protein